MKIGCSEVPKPTYPSSLWPAEWKAPAPLGASVLEVALVMVRLISSLRHIIFSCTEIQGTTPGEGVVLMPSSLRWSFRSSGSQTRQLIVLTTYNLSCWTTWMELARLPWLRKTLQTFPRWFESNHLTSWSFLLTLLLSRWKWQVKCWKRILPVLFAGR